MRLSKTILFVLLFLSGNVAMAGTPRGVPVDGTSVQQTEKALVQLISHFYKAPDYLSLKNYLFFNSSEEENEFDRLTQGYKMSNSPVSSEEIHFVEGPANLQTGEYLFLIPTARGYLPKVFSIIREKQNISIKYKRAFFDADRYSSELFLSTVEKVKYDLEAKSILWNSFEGAELDKHVEALKTDLQNQLKGINYAQKHGLAIIEGYGSAAARKNRLSELDSLSTEQVRERVLQEAAVLLKSISSGHSVERKTAYVNMEGISLELEDILVCSPEGDQKHSALLKDKFTDESTVFDVVSALGPGYVPPISGTGSITWFFDDGSQIVTRFWPENLHSKIVRNYK